MKYLKFLIILLLIIGTIFIINNWDILYSDIEHAYYVLLIKRTLNSKSVIKTIVINSQELGGVRKEAKVYLPDSYSKNNYERYPVLYLLHGYPGTDSDWLINANLQARLDEKISLHIIPPLIVVFPDANGPIIKDSQYIDGIKVKQKIESYIIKELIPYIDATYRTLSTRNSRAIGGVSSGAYGAVYLGLKHNDVFSVIISHSGYFINNEGSMNDLVGDNKQIRDQYEPLTFILKTTLNPKTYIYFDIGRNDNNDFLASNKEFDQILTRLHIEHKFLITDGDHGWNFWSKNIGSSLSFLGKINTFRNSKQP